MIKHNRRPRPVPYQTCGEVSRGRIEFWSNSYLFNKLLIHCRVSIGAVKSLLQKREEYGNNYGGLQCLSENDEEDGDGEDVDSHDGP